MRMPPEVTQGDQAGFCRGTHPIALLAGGNLTFAGTLNANATGGTDGTPSTGGVVGGGAGSARDGGNARLVIKASDGAAPDGADPNVRLSGGFGGMGGIRAADGIGSGGGGGGGGGVHEFAKVFQVVNSVGIVNAAGAAAVFAGRWPA